MIIFAVHTLLVLDGRRALPSGPDRMGWRSDATPRPVRNPKFEIE